MSPQEMVDASRCDPNCRRCTAERTRAARWAGFVLAALGLIATVVSVPVDGPLGVTFAIAGIAAVWGGWSVVQGAATVRKPILKAIDLALWSASIGASSGGLLACFGRQWLTATVLAFAAVGAAVVWLAIWAVHRAVTR